MKHETVQGIEAEWILLFYFCLAVRLRCLGCLHVQKALAALTLERERSWSSPRENIKLMPITSQHPRAECVLRREASRSSKSQLWVILERNENYRRGMLRNPRPKFFGKSWSKYLLEFLTPNISFVHFSASKNSWGTMCMGVFQKEEGVISGVMSKKGSVIRRTS